MHSTSDDTSFYKDQWHKWDDMKSYGPMSRHVRRLIFKLLSKCEFQSVLDVGCGVGTLLLALAKTYPDVTLFGTELYNDALELAKKRLPNARLSVLDITKGTLNRKFDLVLCVDVLEHIKNDLGAMKNLLGMTKKYCVVVVPLGPLFEIERVRVGHVHGYSKREVDDKLQLAGFEIIDSIQWGFPFYNLYRRVLHHLPEKSTTGSYSWQKKLIARTVYLLLGFNLLPIWGERYFVLCTPKKS